MKILHIIAGAQNGGAETFCLDAIKSLHEEGVEQHVICRPHPHFIHALGERKIRYDTLSFNRFKKRAQQKIMAVRINDFEPDIVHCWMNRAASFMPSGMTIPVLGWFGGYYDLKNYKSCDFYMGVTRDIVRHIIHETKKPHRSYVVHTFGTLEDNVPVKKSDFDIPDDAAVVLLLSRMHWKKGVDTLLHAARKMPSHVFFLLAGDGPDIEKYKKLCDRLGLSDRVRFLGWRNDRAALLDIADICVLPSRYEPFGTVIAEAWHANVPLVATKAAGAKQYVTDDHDGLLCEIDDVEGLAQKIMAVLCDKNLGCSLAQNAQKTYEALFHKNVVTRSLIRAYQHIMHSAKSSPVLLEPDAQMCQEGTKAQLDKALDKLNILPRTGMNQSWIHHVAAAYGNFYEDESMAIDAAFIQACGLYNFVTMQRFQTKIEILSEAEINTLLSHVSWMMPELSYSQFVQECKKSDSHRMDNGNKF